MAIGHMGTGNLSGAPLGGHGFGMDYGGMDYGSMASHSEAYNAGDALEAYFECITTCSLDDGACVTRCVEQLREHP